MARNRKSRLRGVTQDDAIAVAARIHELCPKRWRTKQYVQICKKAADVFLSELGKRGTHHRAIADAANATDKHCAETYTTGQYRRVCERISGGFIRLLATRRPGLQGRRRRYGSL
jgi:hypothetical protein